MLDLLKSLYLTSAWLSSNSSGWKSILTRCPTSLFEELLLCVQCIFNLYSVIVLLDSQTWQWLSTNTSCPQSKFPLIVHVSGLVMLCHCVVSYHPCPQRSRETGNVFQSLKLNQTVSHLCGNFSNMFVAELAVLTSVNYSIWQHLEGLLSLILPRSHTLKWLALCYEYVCSKEHCMWVVSSCAW